MWAGCASTRQSLSSTKQQHERLEVRDTVKEQVMVEHRDTLREVTTITVTLRQARQPDAPDDTVKVVQITDRTRASRSEGYRDREEKTIVKTDTVYIEKRDSVEVCTVSGKPISGKQTGLVPTLKWLFAILCAVIVLTLTIKLIPRRASS